MPEFRLSSSLLLVVVIYSCLLPNTTAQPSMVAKPTLDVLLGAKCNVEQATRRFNLSLSLAKSAVSELQNLSAYNWCALWGAEDSLKTAKLIDPGDTLSPEDVFKAVVQPVMLMSPSSYERRMILSQTIENPNITQLVPVLIFFVSPIDIVRNWTLDQQRSICLQLNGLQSKIAKSIATRVLAALNVICRLGQDQSSQQSLLMPGKEGKGAEIRDKASKLVNAKASLTNKNWTVETLLAAASVLTQSDLKSVTCDLLYQLYYSGQAGSFVNALDDTYRARTAAQIVTCAGLLANSSLWNRTELVRLSQCLDELPLSTISAIPAQSWTDSAPDLALINFQRPHIQSKLKSATLSAFGSPSAWTPAAVKSGLGMLASDRRALKQIPESAFASAIADVDTSVMSQSEKINVAYKLKDSAQFKSPKNLSLNDLKNAKDFLGSFSKSYISDLPAANLAQLFLSADAPTDFTSTAMKRAVLDKVKQNVSLSQLNSSAIANMASLLSGAKVSDLRQLDPTAVKQAVLDGAFQSVDLKPRQKAYLVSTVLKSTNASSLIGQLGPLFKQTIPRSMILSADPQALFNTSTSLAMERFQAVTVLSKYISYLKGLSNTTVLDYGAQLGEALQALDAASLAQLPPDFILNAARSLNLLRDSLLPDTIRAIGEVVMNNTANLTDAAAISKLLANGQLDSLSTFLADANTTTLSNISTAAQIAIASGLSQTPLASLTGDKAQDIKDFILNTQAGGAMGLNDSVLQSMGDFICYMDSSDINNTLQSALYAHLPDMCYKCCLNVDTTRAIVQRIAADFFDGLQFNNQDRLFAVLGACLFVIPVQDAMAKFNTTVVASAATDLGNQLTMRADTCQTLRETIPADQAYLQQEDNALASFKSYLVSTITGSAPMSSRKKRQSAAMYFTLNCTSIRTIKGILGSLDNNTLNTLSDADVLDCLDSLMRERSWNRSQLDTIKDCYMKAYGSNYTQAASILMLAGGLEAFDSVNYTNMEITSTSLGNFMSDYVDDHRPFFASAYPNVGIKTRNMWTRFAQLDSLTIENYLNLGPFLCIVDPANITALLNQVNQTDIMGIVSKLGSLRCMADYPSQLQPDDYGTAITKDVPSEDIASMSFFVARLNSTQFSKMTTFDVAQIQPKVLRVMKKDFQKFSVAQINMMSAVQIGAVPCDVVVSSNQTLALLSNGWSCNNASASQTTAASTVGKGVEAVIETADLGGAAATVTTATDAAGAADDGGAADATGDQSATTMAATADAQTTASVGGRDSQTDSTPTAAAGALTTVTAEKAPGSGSQRPGLLFASLLPGLICMSIC